MQLFIRVHNSKLSTGLSHFHFEAAGFIYPRENTRETQLIARFYICPQQGSVLLRDTQK